MTPSPTDWSLVKALFADALDRPERERAPWLEASCDDAVVLAEVRSLLAAQEAIGWTVGQRSHRK